MAEFVLKCEPADKLEFKGKLTEEPATIELKLTNPTDKRQSYKVKCTSNDLFRIRPPLGFLAKDETATVKLTANKLTAPLPDNDKHFFAVHHITVADDAAKPRTAWSEHKGEPDGVKKLFVRFANEGAAADKKPDADKKADADKDDDKKEEKKEEKKEDKKEEEADEKKKDDKKDEDDDKEDDKDEKKDE